MSVCLSETSPAEWKYISEGGATIVFSYQGPPHPVLTSKVLRLSKAPRGRNGTPLCVSNDNPKFAVESQKKVFSRLLDPSYLVDLQIVPLEAQWVEAFAIHHESSRPRERRSISMINCAGRTGVLAPDLVGGLSCVVEIKPKWGFLPNPVHLSPESVPIKTRTCRTCMHAHLKQIEGKNVAIHYCPLDLFSGSKERLETALIGLWDSWIQSNGSINNMHIFNHGKIVLPSDELALKAWSQESLSLAAGASLTTIKAKFINSLLPLIFHTPLLNHISKLQHSLDSLDCEGFAKLAEVECTQSAGLGSSNNVVSSNANFRQPTMEDWELFVNRFLSSNHQKYFSFEPSNLHYHMLAYTLSATFKDCSLMIPLNLHEVNIMAENIKVIDLDIKSLNRIPSWLKLDETIIKEYAKLESRMRKRCIEGRVECYGDISIKAD